MARERPGRPSGVRAAALGRFLPSFLASWLAAAAPAAAAGPVVSAGTGSPPPGPTAPVLDALAPESTVVDLGDVQLQFWWVTRVATEDAGGEAWRRVPQGALVGVVHLSAGWSDIRGYAIRPGTYTLRFALQPQNGDHLGISPYREFLLMAPAAEDDSAAPVGYDDAVALSKKASRRAHPACLSLDPPEATGAPRSVTSNEFGHDVVVFTVPAGADGAPLTFGLVVRGTIEH